MAKFGVINTDEVIFAGDRTRIDVSKSFATPDESQSLSLAVKPSFDDDFIAVTDGYLDWVYPAPGPYTISVNVANQQGDQNTEKQITAIDLLDAKLFATDGDLTVFEPTIMNYLPGQWSSFNVIHFRCKQNIMRWLDNQKVRGLNGAKLTDADLYDSSDFNETAVFMALSLIFNSARVQVGDEFETKAKDYEARARLAASAAAVRLDVNHDGKPEEVDNSTTLMVRV